MNARVSPKIKGVSDILSLLKDLCLGSGNARDIGIRFLVFMVGLLSVVVGHFLKKEILGIGKNFDHMSANIKNMDENARRMEASLEIFKKSINEILSGKLEEMRQDFYALRVLILSLDGKLTKVSLELESYQGLLKHESATVRTSVVVLETKLNETIDHLNRSHETREDVYGFIKILKELELRQEDSFGRIILLESHKTKYETVLKALDRAITAKKQGPGKP